MSDYYNQSITPGNKTIIIQDAMSLTQSGISLGDFRWIVDIIKSTKMKYFTLLENHLYGTDDEGYILHEVDLSAYGSVPTCMSFCMDDFLSESAQFVLSNFDKFVYYKGYGIIPEVFHNFVFDGSIQFNFESKKAIFIDQEKCAKDLTIFPMILTDIFSISNSSYWKCINTINKFNAFPWSSLSYPIQFDHIQQREEISSILNNKSAEGTSNVIFTYNNKHYLLSLYKGLFPFNKADDMSLQIQDCNEDNDYYKNKFYAKFLIYKKKLKITIVIHCIFLNLI